MFGPLSLFIDMRERLSISVLSISPGKWPISYRPSELGGRCWPLGYEPDHEIGGTLVRSVWVHPGDVHFSQGQGHHPILHGCGVDEFQVTPTPV